MTKKNKKYTSEFKQEAIKLALSSERSVSATAKELAIPEGTLNTWIHNAKKSGAYTVTTSEGEVNHVNVAQLLEENKQLKKRLSHVEQEKAILKKAATYFAMELG